MPTATPQLNIMANHVRFEYSGFSSSLPSLMLRYWELASTYSSAKIQTSCDTM